MKDARDPGTVEMTLAPKRGRGRPSTGKAKSAAERMREYRARSVTVNRGVLEVALGNASQVEALSFQVDGMDELAEENRQLRAQVEQLRAELSNVTKKPDGVGLVVSCVRGELEVALAGLRGLGNDFKKQLGSTGCGVLDRIVLNVRFARSELRRIP